jgi:hypothetical protein
MAEGVVYKVTILDRDVKDLGTYTISDALERYEIRVVCVEATDERVPLNPAEWDYE